MISAEMTKSLEERIKKRIKDKIFDDVYPKISMTSVDDVDTRKLPFDSQKSALSLVDLYEKDYVDKMKLEKAKNPNTDQEVAEELTFEQKVWPRVCGMGQGPAHCSSVISSCCPLLWPRTE